MHVGRLFEAEGKKKTLQELEGKMPCNHIGPGVIPAPFSQTRKPYNSQVIEQSHQKVLPQG